MSLPEGFKLLQDLARWLTGQNFALLGFFDRLRIFVPVLIDFSNELMGGSVVWIQEECLASLRNRLLVLTAGEKWVNRRNRSIERSRLQLLRSRELGVCFLDPPQYRQVKPIHERSQSVVRVTFDRLFDFTFGPLPIASKLFDP